jgi:hypothetical protein
MFVFGVCFSFAGKAPIAWKNQSTTRQAMKDHNIWWTAESNASCLGGNSTYAGYVQIHEEASTHPVRYLQSLRNQLPKLLLPILFATFKVSAINFLATRHFLSPQSTSQVAPTHPICYLQSLRNRLPDNAPFFSQALRLSMFCQENLLNGRTRAQPDKQ